MTSFHTEGVRRRLRAVLLPLLVITTPLSPALAAELDCESAEIRQMIKQTLSDKLTLMGFPDAEGFVALVDQLKRDDTPLAGALSRQYQAEYELEEDEIVVCSVQSQPGLEFLMLTVLIRNPDTGGISGLVTNWGLPTIETFGDPLP